MHRMMYKLLLDKITASGIDLDPLEIEVLKSLFYYRKYRKHQYILQESDTLKYDSFIIKGIVRSYLLDVKGNEHIIKFSPEGWWAADLASFFSGVPSDYNIDCMEDCEVLQISQVNLEILLDKIPRLHKFYHLLYRNSVIAYNQRVAASLRYTALERYQDFIKKYPDIGQRVPNHQIASFLGITPQSLSRLRNQMSKS